MVLYDDAPYIPSKQPIAPGQSTSSLTPGSPIALQGMLLVILRERFQEGSGLDWIWQGDIKASDITIEAAYNKEKVDDNKLPGLFLYRTATVTNKVAIGDAVGLQHSTGQMGFYAHATVGFQLDCLSPNYGESQQIADVAYNTLLCSEDIIQKFYDLHDFTHPGMGSTTPAQYDKEVWNTPISFQLEMVLRWRNVPISPVLQNMQVVINQDPEKRMELIDHFSEVALKSLST